MGREEVSFAEGSIRGISIIERSTGEMKSEEAFSRVGDKGLSCEDIAGDLEEISRWKGTEVGTVLRWRDFL